MQANQKNSQMMGSQQQAGYHPLPNQLLQFQQQQQQMLKN